MDAKQIVNRIKNKKELDEEWIEIKNDIVKFLNENHPEEEKKMFRPLGYMEVVTMMCNALERPAQNGVSFN